MRKFLLLLATISLVTGITAAPSSALSASSVATKAKVTAPLAPTISAISSSALKKGKVNVKVTITLPASNGGSKITGSKVSAGGKSCTIEKTKTSCTIKSISNGKSLSVYANSKNIKGYGAKSARVTYAAGASAWSTTSAAPAAPAVSVVADAPAAAACATGGTCVVGDRGPGGGIVYYVSAANFTSTGSTCNTACKYLEVAPATWQSAGVSVANDSTYVWTSNTTLLTDQDITNASTEGVVAYRAEEKVNWKIGQGFNNTKIMKVSGATSAAQAAVLVYAGNSIAGQWFIPSMNEQNELCKYKRGQTTGDLTVACDLSGTLKTGTANDLGGFVEASYWSSSESAVNGAYVSFHQGGFGSVLKSYALTYVRPVRAF